MHETADSIEAAAGRHPGTPPSGRALVIRAGAVAAVSLCALSALGDQTRHLPRAAFEGAVEALCAHPVLVCERGTGQVAPAPAPWLAPVAAPPLATETGDEGLSRCAASRILYVSRLGGRHGP